MVTLELKKRILSVAFVCGVILIFFNRFLTSSGVFFSADEVASDSVNFSYPYRHFVAESMVKEHKIPLWNPYLLSGMPFVAEAQSGVFFPASLLYFIFPFNLAFNLTVITSLALLGIGTYFFAKELGIGNRGSLLTAIAFSLSLCMVARVRHIPIITTLSPIPFAFLFIEKVINDKRVLWAALLSVCIGVSFLGGHLTTAYMAVLVILIYFLTKLVVNSKSEPEPIKEIVLIIFSLFIGISIAAITLIPSLEMYKYSTRIEDFNLSLESAPLLPKYLLMYIYPYLFGDPSKATWDMARFNFWENIGYYGIIPLIFSSAGIYLVLKYKIKKFYPVTVTIAVLFLLSLGANTPFYKLFWQSVPGFSLTRIPGRFLIFLTFFLCIIAGFAFERTIKNKKFVSKNILISLIIFFVVFIDLFWAGYKFNNLIPSSYFESSALTEYLKSDPEVFRVKVLPDIRKNWQNAWENSKGWSGGLELYLDQKENLPGDINLLYKIPSVSAIYESAGHFLPKKPVDLDSIAERLAYENFESSAKFYGLMNVKYFISANPIDDTKSAQLVKIYKGKYYSTYLYKNPFFLHRFYFLKKDVDIENILEKFTDSNTDPKSIVDVDSKITLQELSHTKIVLQLDSISDENLVVSQTFYPGWEAYLDGRRIDLNNVNLAYQSVSVPQGKHELELKYNPVSYKLGVLVSVISFTSLLVIIIIQILYKLKNANKK